MCVVVGAQAGCGDMVSIQVRVDWFVRPHVRPPGRGPTHYPGHRWFAGVCVLALRLEASGRDHTALLNLNINYPLTEGLALLL
jgi:hypothetical protein